jgi:serine protease Do
MRIRKTEFKSKLKIALLTLLITSNSLASSIENVPVPNNGSSESPSLTVSKSAQSFVYEVVQLKSGEESAAFAKPLPYDLLPYSIRTDKYVSIGSAFEVEGKFISAAHVINLNTGRLPTAYFIRDSSGKVYELDQVEAYSVDRDFIVFTVKNKKASSGLKVAQGTPFNEKVFSVGNAFGQGIVVREGLLTSETPEDESGRWKWLRFSAPASPGNSGGPLLNSSGAVVGIILMKTANENLNYGLPIQEALSHLKEATYHAQMISGVFNSSRRVRMAFDHSFKVPQNYKSLEVEVSSNANRNIDALSTRFRKENASQFFPYGKGSIQLLDREGTWSALPLFVAEDGDTWQAYNPEKSVGVRLDDDGRVTYASLKGIIQIYLKTPKSVSSVEIISDSKKHMDLVLKGLPADVKIGDVSTKIMSLGKSATESNYLDSYGRKWVLRTWKYPVTGELLVTASLPLPNGIFTQMLAVAPSREHDASVDVKFYSDFFLGAYAGTLAQWQEFTSSKNAYRPSFLASNSISTHQGSFSGKIKELSFQLSPDMFSNFKEDQVGLKVWPAVVNGKQELAIFGYGIAYANDESIGVDRTLKPNDSSSESAKTWNSFLQMISPFDGVATQREGEAFVKRISNKFTSMKADARDKQTVLYLVSSSTRTNKAGRADQLLSNAEKSILTQ